MSEIKAVVFDMDGVLVDAKEWHYEALNLALGLFGYTIQRTEHVETFDGLPTKRKLEILTAERGLPAGLHRFINEMKQSYTMEMIHTRCRPTFAHQFALAHLKREGMLIGVASNSIRESVELMMQKTALSQYLDVLLGATDVKLPKPDPDIYLEAVSRLGLTSAEVLVVEDNQNGIAAAKAAGCHVLEVEDTHEVNLENIHKRIAEIEAGIETEGVHA
ncbi:HAD family hydrolase [Subtercola boreus]|uniref:HAD family hydrolase n=1 Tax=Subtercola boreus TaxID=120213 RepID=A0A3E0WCT3_9MICO|nr:HAD family phosphatase [Subtercola boreus]RFA22633.1 HAD family hydrolase [Subtercola boreus]RFA22989.1 HAD family hydrolase [Subtercola boreus]RFA28740.1 HAD family hydrolase [Subtercola boreus]